MKQTYRTGIMVPLQGETAGVLTVPLRLADNQIALVGAVVFHHKPNTDGAYNVMMSLQARNDVEGVTDEGTHIALVDKSQDTIAVAVENNNETSNDETGVITKSTSTNSLTHSSTLLPYFLAILTSLLYALYLSVNLVSLCL